MPISKQYFSITPINNIPVSVATNTFTNGFRHQGNPTIKFSIPASERLLEISSLSLVGQFITLNNNESLNSLASINDNNGASLSTAAAANIPAYGGVQNCLDKIVIQSKKSNTELSNQTNYSLFSSLRQAHANNKDDYIQVPSIKTLAGGENAQYQNRRFNLTPESGDLNLGGHGGAANKNVGQHFSLSLDVPLLKTQDLHLGNNFCNGLMITIHLNTDAAVYGQKYRDTDITGQPDADISQVSYVLKNLRLEGRYIVPTPQEVKAYPQVMTMNDRLNLINDIQSSNDSDNYSPNLNMVSGIVSVSLDEDQQNNKQFEQNNFRLPVGLKNMTQSKDSLRFPFDFPVPVVPNYESPIDNASPGVTALDPAAMDNKYHLQGDAELRMMFAKALLGGREANHSSARVDLTNNNLNEDYVERGGTANTSGIGNQGNPDVLGVGCDYSYNLMNFQQFSGSDYNLNTESGVKTQDSSLPSSRNNKNEVLQTYVKHISQINLNSLVKTM
jgi:hypothetical protein